MTAGPAVWVADAVPPGACVPDGEGVLVLVPVPIWGFRNMKTPATTAIMMMAMMAMAMSFPFLRRGFGGFGGAAVGIDPGTSGVGGRSFGEKSRGINRRGAGFFCGSAGAGAGNT